MRKSLDLNQEKKKNAKTGEKSVPMVSKKLDFGENFFWGPGLSMIWGFLTCLCRFDHHHEAHTRTALRGSQTRSPDAIFREKGGL